MPDVKPERYTYEKEGGEKSDRLLLIPDPPKDTVLAIDLSELEERVVADILRHQESYKTYLEQNKPKTFAQFYADNGGDPKLIKYRTFKLSGLKKAAL